MASAPAPVGALRPGRRRLGVREAHCLLTTAQKPGAGTPLYSRFVNRPLGRFLAAVALSLGLPPNAVSAISGAFSVGAIAVIVLGTPSVTTAAVVAALLVLGYALDSADGQVARVTGAGSVLGEWLDHMIDATKVAALHAAVCWSVLSHGQPERWRIAVTLGFGIVSSVLFFGMILTDQLRRTAGMPKEPPAGTGADLIRAVLVLPTDYGILCLAFLLFGWPAVFYGVYAALFAGTLVLLTVALARWARQLRRLDQPGAAG